MRACRIGRTYGVDDREMLSVPQRLEGRQGGMESEEAIEIDGGVILPRGVARGTWDRDGGAEVVVRGLSVRDDDVQSIGRTALKDGDQDFLARSAAFRVQGSLQPQRRASHADHRERGIF